jgi:hypothetical protein
MAIAKIHYFEKALEVQKNLTAELTSAIANRCGATGVRRYLRTYGAYYKTVLRLVQPQVMTGLWNLNLPNIRKILWM